MLNITALDSQLDNLRSQCLDAESQLTALRKQVHEAEVRAKDVRAQLQQAEESAERRHNDTPSISHVDSTYSNSSLRTLTQFDFTPEEYKRYGRQLIIPEIGGSGQHALKTAKVLIVGVGGLGCPAAAYLAGAGVGTIGLIDGDVAEVSNLHRQIAHTTDRVGMSKVTSACTYLRSLNPLVDYQQYREHLTPEKAISIFEAYDIVLDCTDHPTSRYLISDACVLTGRPLVSASALKTEGQLIVLNNPPKPAGNAAGGPCYRCIFPKPPPAETIVSCGEGGILGPVVGVMGVLQALETIKVLTKPKQEISTSSPRASMLLFSAYGDVQFRTIKMRSRRSACTACSSEHTITRKSLESGSLDYVAFCGAQHATDVLAPERRVAASTFARDAFSSSSKIVDVRDETQFELCSLQHSINIPWTGDAASWQKAAHDLKLAASDQIYLICRHGNDSQLAAKALVEARPEAADKIVDITGGFQAWKREVDADWPEY